MPSVSEASHEEIPRYLDCVIITFTGSLSLVVATGRSPLHKHASRCDTVSIARDDKKEGRNDKKEGRDDKKEGSE